MKHDVLQLLKETDIEQQHEGLQFAAARHPYTRSIIAYFLDDLSFAGAVQSGAVFAV